MCASKERLVSSSNDDEYNIKTTNLKFETIENEIEQQVTDLITDRYLLDFNDAKEVFLHVQKWLDDAKSYYTLENHASDYVQIVQDESQSYKYLAFFEENEDRQAKMHKRRINLLEDVVDELSESYYKSVCQQIWIELGEIYAEILDIKLDKIKETRPVPRALIKINSLTKSAIKYYDKFLDSLKKHETEKFSDEMVRPALYSYFHLGRLYNKFLTPDKQLQLDYAKKSLDAYTFLVNYCEKDTKAAEIMSGELSICKDFMQLLPMKINKLQKNTSE